MDQSVRENLKVFASIKKYEKLLIGRGIDPNVASIDHGMIPGQRWLLGQNRNKTISFIRGVVGQFSKYVKGVTLENIDVNYINSCIQEGSAAIPGLQNLATTYEEDENFKACLNVQIEDFERHNVKLKDIISEYQNTNSYHYHVPRSVTKSAISSTGIKEYFPDETNSVNSQDLCEGYNNCSNDDLNYCNDDSLDMYIDVNQDANHNVDHNDVNYNNTHV